MIVCIGFPPPAVGSAGCSSVESLDQYGAANVNVGGAGAAADRYAALVSPTDAAKFASTERSSATRHAPVCRPITLVSTAMPACSSPLARAFEPALR